MRAPRLATIAVLFAIISIYTPSANAQVFDSGVGRCGLCGHSERDTQRYINSFLNQMFFPRSLKNRAFVAANLYLLTVTFTMHGNKSPDPNYASVTIAITAEVKNALPTGSYHVTATTPGGKTLSGTYAIGDTRFRVIDVPVGRMVLTRTGADDGRTGAPTSGSSQIQARTRGPAKCSRSRREDRHNETIVWCSED